jgi:hypothetical protein
MTLRRRDGGGSLQGGVTQKDLPIFCGEKNLRHELFQSLFFRVVQRSGCSLICG